MTKTPSPPDAYAEFGQTLGFAERTLSAVLRAHLAARDTEPEQWYALKLLAAGGAGGVPRHELVARLGGSPTFDPESADALLRELGSDGLVEDGASVRLTVIGEAAFSELRAYVLGATVELLGQFELDDIETTVRTLRAITARAEAA